MGGLSQEKWNPLIINFRKVRFIFKPKPLMSLSSSTQERYCKLYSHITTEIVQGTRQQSVASNVFFLGENGVSYSGFIANSYCQFTTFSEKSDIGWCSKMSMAKRNVCCSLSNCFDWHCRIWLAFVDFFNGHGKTMFSVVVCRVFNNKWEKFVWVWSFTSRSILRSYLGIRIVSIIWWNF